MCSFLARTRTLNPLSANTTTWSNTLKQLIGYCRRIVSVCLTILWGWHLKDCSPQSTILYIKLQVLSNDFMHSLLQLEFAQNKQKINPSTRHLQYSSISQCVFLFSQSRGTAKLHGWYDKTGFKLGKKSRFAKKVRVK